MGSGRGIEMGIVIAGHADHFRAEPVASQRGKVTLAIVVLSAAEGAEAHQFDGDDSSWIRRQAGGPGNGIKLQRTGTASLELESSCETGGEEPAVASGDHGRPGTLHRCGTAGVESLIEVFVQRRPEHPGLNLSVRRIWHAGTLDEFQIA